MIEINQPLITVITVVYNNVNSIKETIRSILSQTYKNIEYIVIDGNSNDGTIEAICEYSDEIDKIISEPDKGIYDAMNKGIESASGDYIIFMNSGDEFYDINVLSVIFHKRENYDVIYGNHCQDFGTYKRIIKAKCPSDKEPMTFCHQSVFVKSEILKKNKFNLLYKICSDRDLFIRIYKQKVTYKYFNNTISIIEAFGTSNQNRIATLKEIKNIYKINNIEKGILLDLSLIKGYFISIIEIIFGKGIFNKLRKFKNRILEN